MPLARRLRSLVALTTVGCAAAVAQTPAEAPVAPARNDYSTAQTWLCRPGRKDACVVDLSTTIVAADGKLQREAFKARSDAPIDCFYIYPTVSRDPTGNSDMNPGPEEAGVIQQQFARFGKHCRLFAPLYRQLSLAGLRSSLMGAPIPSDRVLGYNDVVDAWNYYLEHDNNGRGVVLIGHSQGGAILTALLNKEIEGKPVQSKLISALVLGSTVTVPKGAHIGGTFKTLPLCRAATQTGCVIAYSSFRSNLPPPDNARYGKVPEAELVAGCTNPAALGGGSGELRSYLAATRSEVGAAVVAAPWTSPPQPIETPFVSVPGLLSARCVDNQFGSYLEITVNADPKDARVDDINGDLLLNGQVQASWGLHLIDVNLTMGNLLDVVAAQSKAYLAKKKT